MRHEIVEGEGDYSLPTAYLALLFKRVSKLFHRDEDAPQEQDDESPE